jgi:endonuclease-3
MPSKINWEEAVRPVLKKYKGKKHPLLYRNRYELLVMVVLSSQVTDDLVNQLSPALFKAFPDMESLSRADTEALQPYIGKVRSFFKKAKWLVEIAQRLKTDGQIPVTMDELTALPGIGRKSANVIMREANVKPEGVIVDLHVLRVAPRIGIAKGEDPKKIEEQIMKVVPQEDWDVGMCLSFLGREICRPTDPKCGICVMNSVCKYYSRLKKSK